MRPDGFYWVRDFEEWLVAHWDEQLGRWNSTHYGPECDMSDQRWLEIGPRIEPPDIQ